MTTAQDKVREANKTKVVEIFTVTADGETGEWLGEPEPTGETTTLHDWFLREDSDTENFATYEHFADEDDMRGTTRALIVRWA